MDLLATARAPRPARPVRGFAVAEVVDDGGDPIVSDVVQVVLVEDLEALFRAHYGRLVRASTVAGGDGRRWNGGDRPGG